MDRILFHLERGRVSDRLILRALFFSLLALAIVSIITVSKHYSALTPVKGGALVEGVVGIPRFVNPALAMTRADQDLVALIYSGLLKLGPGNTLAPDIAEQVTLLDDGLSYHILVRRDVVFHDGRPLTADDVVYTIGLVQNPDLKSPLRGNWTGVTVEKMGEYELIVRLQEAYAPFMENFTLGIMPRHIWVDVPLEHLPFSRYNTEPIGSGPFMVHSVHRNDYGLISGYTLRAFGEALRPPNLSGIDVRFFQNEPELADALKQGQVDATAHLPAEAIARLDKEAFRLIEAPLPRVFGLFFNQNRSPILRDAAAREALKEVIDREALVATVLGGHGVPVALPVLLEHDAVEYAGASPAETIAAPLERAESILRQGGWSRNDRGLWEKRIDGSSVTLDVTLRTQNVPVYNAIATEVAALWRSLGVVVQIEQFEQADLLQSVISPRNFQVLLFALDVSRTQDLYPFWHSSQKNDPGLNIAQYANITVDRILETARVAHDHEARNAYLREAAAIIEKETPAIFLFAPTVTYVVGASVTTAPWPHIGRPADRFATISDWYVRKNWLWPFFSFDRPETSVETNQFLSGIHY
jgi:peptide/nickel transport system substrate-binding protein